MEDPDPGAVTLVKHPASLGALQKQMVGRNKQIAADSEKRRATLQQEYVATLQRMMTGLTKKGRIELFELTDDQPNEVEQPSVDDDYIPFGKLWNVTPHFDTYRKAKIFLDKHTTDIRTRKPSKQKLQVHATDWLKHLPKGESDLTDEQLERLCQEIGIRRSEERHGK